MHLGLVMADAPTPLDIVLLHESQNVRGSTALDAVDMHVEIGQGNGIG